MPNWAYNEEKIVGPADEIRKLYELLNSWIQNGENISYFGKRWLGNIVTGAGFNYQDEEHPDGLYCSGSITDMFILDLFDEDKTCISFATETAWSIADDMWKAILAKFAPHSTYHYLSEESGMESYLKHDPDNLCFSYCDYFVNSYVEIDNVPEQYRDLAEEFYENPYWDEGSLQDILQEFLGEKTMEQLLSDFKNIDFGENCFIDICKIEVI